MLYLIDTQQPFAEGDASFLGIVRQHIDSIFIVQTKIDLWRQPQRDGRPAWEHARERIARLAAVHAPGTYVYALSAREYAEGKLDARPRRRSSAAGFRQFLAALDASLIMRTGRARLLRARTIAPTPRPTDEIAHIDREIGCSGSDAVDARRTDEAPSYRALQELDERARAQRDALLAEGASAYGEVEERGRTLADDLERVCRRLRHRRRRASARSRAAASDRRPRRSGRGRGIRARDASRTALDDLERAAETPGCRGRFAGCSNDAAAEAFRRGIRHEPMGGDVRAALPRRSCSKRSAVRPSTW